MTFSEDDLKQWYRAGGESMATWVQIAGEILDPESQAPAELRALVHSAAAANFSGDLDALLQAARTLYDVFEAMEGDNTPAGRLRGVLSLIEVFGSVQADAGAIQVDARYLGQSGTDQTSSDQTSNN